MNELLGNERLDFLVTVLLAADLFCLAARLGTHFVIAAAAFLGSGRPGNAFQLATAVMKVDGHSRRRETVHQQKQYDKKFFHPVLQT